MNNVFGLITTLTRRIGLEGAERKKKISTKVSVSTVNVR